MKKVQIRLRVTAHTQPVTFEQLPTGKIVTTLARDGKQVMAAKTIPVGQVLTVAYETLHHWGVIFQDELDKIYLIAKDVAEVYEEAKGIWQSFKLWWKNLFNKKVTVPVYEPGKLPTNKPYEKH